MSWSPGMQRWLLDAPQHGLNVGLYKSKRWNGSAGRVRAPHVIPDEALLTQNVREILTQKDLNNILLTDGFIDTEALDPITTEGGGSLII